ncbi:MAG: Ig-like domain-containing protein, partial [Methylococcaceae bacterium]|nr:Ig-like domain-containing protein [Methylococcaceae bacterium]
YYLTVDDGAISDTAGESFAGFVDADTLNFFTAGVDRLPPKLIGANPVDDKHFLLAFDETVQLGNGSIELHKLADHSLIESFNQGVGSAGGNVTVSKSGVVINPLANLDPATQYYFTVSDTAITDLVGNAFAGIDNPNQLSFSTLMPDQQAPLLINSSPLDNQTNVANPTINMTFNEEVKFGVGAITLHKAADGSVVETFIQGQGSVGDNAVINGTFVSVNPSLIQYEPATLYYITVADNALTDKAGNAFAGFTDPTRLNFTTASPDTKAPELISASPIDNQTHIGVNVDINLNFNEALRFGNGHIELHNMADDSLVESFVQGVGSAGGTINVDALSSGTLIIDPAADLLLGTQYYLTVAGDAITDLNGNAYSGFVDPYSLNFKTTADPDAVSSGSVTGFELSLSSSDAVALVGVHDLPAALY